KWVYPGMSLDIVVNHHVPTFGFAPAVFIVMAAFIEFVVGYLLVVGILNRVLGFVVTVIFILTTMLFGFTEIIGHFMIHIVLNIGYNYNINKRICSRLAGFFYLMNRLFFF